MSLPIMNYFVFDGRNTKDWRIGLSGTGVYNAPARDVTVIDVPGRNGSAIIDNGRYLNTTVTYPCWIAKGFFEKIDDFRAFLIEHSDGYYRLEDTYHPDEYRMAQYVGPFEASPGTRNLSGRFDVAFNCKPQRWLKSGDEFEKIINVTKTLYNPTRFAAMPVFRTTKTGAITVNGETITVETLEGQEYLDIDTERYVAYNGGTVFPSAVVFPPQNPGLLPGENEITLTSSMRSYVQVKPRWWTV